MEFIQGGPILDLGKAEFCERNGVDKHRVLTELLHAFGIMAFKDGMFHADPHAGNVRLVLDPNAPGGAKPVLLDWGLIREITDAERLGLAKVFHSLANFDIAGLFDVLESLGFSLRQELLNDDLKRDLIEKARGVVKDTINRHKTRENAREELAEFKARLNRAKEDAGMEGSMSPIYFLEDWPRCIIFFMRMLQILRGLCVACDAEGMPLLKIFSSHAREALQEGSRRQMLSSSLRIFGGRGDGIGHETPFTPKARVSRDSTLESQLQQKLQELQSRKQVVGAQVVVLRDNKVICSVAHGTLSTIDARPVQEQTRFPLLGATAGLAGLALLRTLRRKSGELIKAAEDANMKPENLLRKMLVSFPGHFGPFHLAGGVNRGNFGQSSGSRSAPCLAMGRTYRVTGGASNGLLVRQQRALSSTACAERLRHGSVVQELELTEGRLRYSLLFGVGPAEGWVSIHCKGQALLVETHLTDLAEAAAQAPWVNRVELMDVLMQVAESLDRGPRFRASKVLEGTNVPHVIEVEAMPGSMSLDEFWPSNCELSFAEMQDLYWRITCSSSCDSCTLALALTLKEMADHATLQHQGCRVVNLLVLNTLLDIRDLDELILVEKLSGARLPVLNTAASYDGNAAWRALGLASPKVDLGALGRAAFEAVPHWWLAAVLESEDGRCMLHLDMCNYAYSSNRLESEPSSFHCHSFVTPGYELTPDAFPKLHRFRLGPKVNGLPPSCFSLKPLAELRQLRCSFGPVFATPLCTFAENKLGCNFGERFVVSDDESLGALTVLHSDYCRAAQRIRQRIFGRLPAHTAAQILEIPGRPDLGGALVSLLEAIPRMKESLRSLGGLLSGDSTTPRGVSEVFSGCNPDITLAELLSHRVGLQDAFPPDFKQSSLDDLNGMVAHLEQDILKPTEDSHYAYLLQSFVLAKLGSCIADQDDFLHWLGAELGPCGLDVALPAGRGREASVCRDLPDLARVSLQEVKAARSRRTQKASEGEVEADSSTSSRAKARVPRNLLQAIAQDPLVFDPLQGNAGAGGLFRGGLSMCASARGLAELMASEELQSDLETLHALTLEGVDKTALGWFLTGGATHWTAGGLQALDLRGIGSRALRGYQQTGYGVVSGFGPVFASFPNLNLTVAVLVNDVIHGRRASEELLTTVLSNFGVVRGLQWGWVATGVS
ncbi:unnamed protein product [Cladocopium goreaui]|uniref:ABC1 atypical kinase-like domain-containing protein n=1 Tax=Cladocopium goreaui TaxID=2562237 RepID=A0A9P1C1C5_9DINO|nr:unnamed protein product [Cladocopium goreaui]